MQPTVYTCAVEPCTVRRKNFNHFEIACFTDHITSPSGILMPVGRLVEVIHRHEAMVMVDGAHAPGQVPLNLNKLNADFYTGTCVL